MHSIKATLRQYKKKPDGTSPIVIRLTRNRKHQYFFLGYYIKPEQWDAIGMKVKKSHPNSTRLNLRIQEKILEVSKYVMDGETEKKEVTPQQLKAKIRNVNLNSFFKLAEEYETELEKLKKFNQLASEKPRIKYFRIFVGNGDIKFEDITVPLLRRFVVYLKTERNATEWTCMNYLVVIRTIYNRAISQGLVESKHYPFGPGKIQIKFPESMKVGLTESEVSKLENLELKVNSPYWHARNLWLCSFYLAGVRISDVIKLRWSDFQNGRLIYRMKKNNKIVSLKTPEKVTGILKLYKESATRSKYIFPYVLQDLEDGSKKMQTTIRKANSVINDHLKLLAKECGINKNLTMHISRHTFGQIAGDKIPPQILQKLYRHSDLKTTINYQGNFISKDLDTALDTILDF